MESLKRFILVAIIVAAVLPITNAAAHQGANPGESLFAQSSRALLDREFSDPRLSYVLMDLQTGQQIAARWSDPETPVPVGSVVKPFAALAYARHHERFPQFVCRGSADRCWLPKGHGAMNLSSAIGHSCNAYFRKLARQLPREDIDETIAEFGAGELRNDAPTSSYLGMGDDWQMSPTQITQAFRKLLLSEDRGAAEVRKGMLMAATGGTANAIDKAVRGGALAKTGTAPCTHRPRGSADGFVVAMFPAEAPRTLLLLRVHDTTGARSAEVAARMISRLGEQDASR